MVLAAAASAKQDSLKVSVNGFTSPTSVWWPTGQFSKKVKTAEVVVWFHGGMTSGNCSKGLIAGNDFAKLYPSKIVVSISACRERHWWTAEAPALVDMALDSIAARRKSKVETVSLVGISDGTLGVLSYSISGSRNVTNRLLMSSNGSIVGDAKTLASQEKLSSGRYRFLQGGADRLYSPQESVPWIEAFCRQVGTDCELRYDPEGEHDWSYWRDRRLEWIHEGVPLKL